MLADEVRPSEEMVRKAWKTNGDGGGVAWREDGKVRWHKGLNLVQMLDYCAQLPLPFVAHFRIQSSGGVSKYLTHPFPMNTVDTNELEGVTADEVLFHNGTWSDWESRLLNAIERFGVRLPGGPWNDTRAMAFCASLYGNGYIDLIKEKGVAFGPSTMEMFWGRSGWDEVEGVWCSNDYFWKSFTNVNDPTGAYGRGAAFSTPQGSNLPVKTVTTVASMCKYHWCSTTDNIKANGYCAMHQWCNELDVAGATGTSGANKTAIQVAAVALPDKVAGAATAPAVQVITAGNGPLVPASGGGRKEIPFLVPDDANHPLSLIAAKYLKGDIGFRKMKTYAKNWEKKAAKAALRAAPLSGQEFTPLNVGL